MAALTKSVLDQLIRYEDTTGKLFWLERPVELFRNEQAAVLWNARYADREAFTYSDSDGYKVGTIFGRTYKAHRVVWLLKTGSWPSKRIDHIDGVRSNNVFANLRDVVWGVNCRNRSMGTKNTSGIVGVRWDTQTNKWQAYIKVDRKLIHLGKFDDKAQAVQARYLAEQKYDFTNRHGKRAA